MPNIHRVSVAWQGWPGSPGVSQFYMKQSPDYQGVVDDLRTFFDAVKALLPSGLTVQVPVSGDTLNDNTGGIVGSWSATTPPLVVTGTGAGAYAGNAGAVIHWLTLAVVNGRRLRGRTFLVPLISTAYDTAGSLSTAALSTLSTAAGNLNITSGADLVVWHRPVNGAGGSSEIFNSVRVPDLAVSLRSRRI